MKLFHMLLGEQSMCNTFSSESGILITELRYLRPWNAAVQNPDDYELVGFKMLCLMIRGHLDQELSSRILITSGQLEVLEQFRMIKETICSKALKGKTKFMVDVIEKNVEIQDTLKWLTWSLLFRTLFHRTNSTHKIQSVTVISAVLQSFGSDGSLKAYSTITSTLHKIVWILRCTAVLACKTLLMHPGLAREVCKEISTAEVSMEKLSILWRGAYQEYTGQEPHSNVSVDIKR
jgi:hypothetical protein